MNPNVRKLFDLDRLHDYKRAAPLILVNGLAEQSESWFANRAFWSRHFDVKVPELLVYDGASLHQRIDAGGEITVDYLTDRLADLPRRVRPASALQPRRLEPGRPGHPDLRRPAIPRRWRGLVLICPSGLYGDENLPMMEGVRRSQYDTLVKSVFHRAPLRQRRRWSRSIERKFQDRQWKKGVLRTLRGTVGHSVAPLLPMVAQPTLMIWGANDRVISDVAGSIRAADQILKGPAGGHPQVRPRAPDREVAAGQRAGPPLPPRQAQDDPPALDPARFLAKHEERSRRLRQPQKSR